MFRTPRRCLFAVAALFAVPLVVARAEPVQTGQVISLSGDGWLLATDGQNEGRAAAWYDAPRAEAVPTHVPWIIQDAFPGYHGVAWYWRHFTAPPNPHPGGRYLLRFWQVDYRAEVWLNGRPLGAHEGGESPFLLDATAAIRPGEVNHLAVRVLNPTHEPIDGIVLAETAHRNKALPYGPGSAWDQGGIVDDVELLAAPAVRVADLFVRADWQTGAVRVEATIDNGAEPTAGAIEWAIAPAAGGATLVVTESACQVPPGESKVEAQLQVNQHRLWDVKEPYLYRLTARVHAAGAASCDEASVRFGFRDFRLARGAFRLNGQRVFLRSSHTGNCAPIGLELAHDKDFFRRDLVNAKFMGFNAIRFIAGVAKRHQLDLADELGLLVYEESYAGWLMGHSAKFAERYDESVLGMVRRDRNHPSLAVWGLLNETFDGPVFRHAVGLLPRLRALDDTRLVLLNSGRWNAANSAAGIASWREADRPDPCATFNATRHPVSALGITWQPGQLALHPGREGQCAAVRWTAPADDQIELSAAFGSIAERATTDVHVLHAGREVFGGGINVSGAGPRQSCQVRLRVRRGEPVDCVVGFGNGDYGADTTAVAVAIRSASGQTFDATADFSPQHNPHGPWSFGQMAPGGTSDASTFVPFSVCLAVADVGAASNPGSTEWEDVLDEWHPYQRVPHTADIVHTLRTMSGRHGLPTGFSGKGQDPARFFKVLRDDDRTPLFVSEYGIGSANDLVRLVRLYEQAGKPDVEDARLYRAWRDQFLADWERWQMAAAFDRPEDFFAASTARMASQRLLGLNALRANPDVIGYSLTGTVDQGMTGEGLWTTFRELKPGTADAVFDGLAPLRWCLFAEPVNIYRGATVRLEAVLANEDALPAGEYPVTFRVVGPEANVAWEQTQTVVVPPRAAAAADEPPLALPVLAADVPVDGPAGPYRFSATFQRGAAAAGERIEFFVDDPATMPAVDAGVALWGNDDGLSQWLTDHRIRTRAFAAQAPADGEVILVAGRPPAADGARAFEQLTGRIRAGVPAVFLCPELFAQRGMPTARLLAGGVQLVGLPSWLYHKEEWCKRHPIFAGLPAPGLLDYTFYREVIPDAAFVGPEVPLEAVAGAINATIGYSSGLLVAVYPLGEGRFVLSALSVRENLGRDPVAERLLRNLLRYAGSLGPQAAR